MKIVVSEYSSGFADYSHVLCNELAKDRGIDELIYLTDENNFYMGQLDQRIKAIMLFRGFASDAQHRKGSVLWLWNRFCVALLNCMRRNRFIKKERPDAVLIQATLARFDCHFLQAIRKTTKVVLVVHDVLVPTESMSWSKKALKKMYRNADILTVHSMTNKEQLINFFGIDEKKITVIPHGVKSTYNKRDRTECRNKINIKGDKKVLLFYGGIRQSKGLDILIKALRGIECTLVIAGKPPYGETFDEYKKLIIDNRIDTIEHIEFTEDDFRDVLFQASDYLVLPYREFYSQSGVFMQAIQYRLPIIATDVSSFGEYIMKYDIGFIARPNDVDSLHRTIQVALAENKDYEENMQRAVAENCWEVAAGLYADLMKDGKSQ